MPHRAVTHRSLRATMSLSLPGELHISFRSGLSALQLCDLCIFVRAARAGGLKSLGICGCIDIFIVWGTAVVCIVVMGVLEMMTF